MTTSLPRTLLIVTVFAAMACSQSDSPDDSFGTGGSDNGSSDAGASESDSEENSAGDDAASSDDLNPDGDETNAEGAPGDDVRSEDMEGDSGAPATDAERVSCTTDPQSVGVRCDGVADCADASDERGCTQYECNFTNLTIDYSDLCDGDGDCSLFDDEDGPACADLFSCGDLRIFSWRRCDLVSDCADGSDERDCEEYVCPDTGVPVDAATFCDGIFDCNGRQDELQPQCYPAFVCNSGTEVPLSARCDGTTDCLEGEDEADCGRFACDSGFSIPVERLCDGEADCADSSDENADRCGTDACEGSADCEGSAG
jgi:hypothetical protein